TRGNSLNVELNDQSILNFYYALFPTIENFRPPARLMKFPHVGITCLDDSGRILSFKDQTFVDRTILQRKVDLPVVLIESQEDNLFNEEFGIMVPGENENFKQEGRDWERPARILLYNDDEILLDAEVGIRIHGHATRDLPQKSLKVYFRPKYDSLKFPGHFLNRDHDLNRVLVRSFHSDFIGNEFTDFGFRDDLVMRIIGEENLVYGQRSRPCVVFLNGEYWGIYSLHEATDDDFIAGIEDLTADEITLLSGPESGYFASRPVRHLDLDDAMERRRFEQFYDFENLVDYFLFQTFFANTDWPHNNIKFWHKTNTDLPYKFILFDMDATFKFPGQNPFTRLNSEAGFTSRYPSKYYQLYDVLLNSDHFIQSLRKRYFDLRNDLLAPERMLGLAREWKESIEPHILDQKERWHYPRRKRDWEKSFEEIEHFIVTRQLHFDQFINDLTPSVIFPNPSSTGILQLKESDKTHYSSVAVFDLTGMKLFESDIQEGSFDLSDLSGRGMVIVKLYGNFGSRVERVLLP
ncbi:MAG: CotH kinase family protein, partial [Saprospiraceae bacterium]|nr:CotH kinase family protein [Saprospiraceae bacterium]